MSYNEITWDALQTQLQEEITALRAILSALVEQQQIHAAGAQPLFSPSVESMQEELAAIQRKRFETTKQVIGCGDFSMQDIFFAEWLKTSDPEYDLLPLWEQVTCLSQKIADQMEQKGQLQPLPEMKKAATHKKIDTLES